MPLKNHPHSEIASENSELLRKMSLLDAASLEQLIERIHASPEPKNSPLPMQKGQEISLCLIAMCADDPRRALDILIHAKERFGDDQARCLAGEQLLSYVLANLAKRDPAAALEPLRYLVTEWPGDSFGRYEQTSGRTGLYSLVARERPEFGTMGAAIEDDSQRTDLVNSLRMEANRHPDLVKSALKSISGRYTYHQVQPEAAMKWIESLNLTDAEKLSLAPILFPDNIYRGSGKDQWPQIEWMVSYLPESEEKKRIIREAVIHTPRSSPERIEFLKLHGIDPGEN